MEPIDTILALVSFFLAILSLFYECSLPISFVILEVLSSATLSGIFRFSPSLSGLLLTATNPLRLFRVLPNPVSLLRVSSGLSRFLPPSSLTTGLFRFSPDPLAVSQVHTELSQVSSDLKKISQIAADSKAVMQSIPNPSQLFLVTTDAAKFKHPGLDPDPLAISRVHTELSQVSSDLMETSPVAVDTKTLLQAIPNPSQLLLATADAAKVKHPESNPIKTSQVPLQGGSFHITQSKPVDLGISPSQSLLQAIPDTTTLLKIAQAESLPSSSNIGSVLSSTNKDPAYRAQDRPPPTILENKCHPAADDLCKRLDNFFLEHWPFESQHEKDIFVTAQLNRWACYAMPEAKSDRVYDSCRVNTLLFLLDGECYKPRTITNIMFFRRTWQADTEGQIRRRI